MRLMGDPKMAEGLSPEACEENKQLDDAKMSLKYTRGRGTFFIVVGFTFALINFLSMFPQEEERLLSYNTLFEVVGKLSESLMMHLQSGNDVVTMCEHLTDIAIPPAERACDEFLASPDRVLLVRAQP
eukprot:gene24418-28331_t